MHATRGMFRPESIIVVQKRLESTNSDEFWILLSRTGDTGTVLKRG